MTLDTLELTPTIADLFSWQLDIAASSQDPAAFQLLKSAHEAFIAGRQNATVTRLEYAQRSAPSHRGITLLLGYTRVQAAIPTATEPLEFLLSNGSNRAAWLGLAAARLQTGDVAAAASELNQGLSRHSPPTNVWEQRMTASIVELTGVVGWCSLRPNGTLLLGGKAASAPMKHLSATADGAELTLRSVGARRRGATRHTRAMQLGGDWGTAQYLEVLFDGVPLLGSPIHVCDITSVSGFVSAENNELSGWCWYENADDHPVQLTIEDALTGATLGDAEALALLMDGDSFSALDRPRKFSVAIDTLPVHVELVRVLGPRRANLYGNPVDPFGERQSAAAAVDAIALRYPSTDRPRHFDTPRQPSTPASVRGRQPIVDIYAHRPPVDVCIPVYRGHEVTLKAIECVLATDEGLGRVIVVSDASPDADLLSDLDSLAVQGRIILHKEDKNRGFPGAANIALRLAGGSDVVLVNSDAFVTPKWLRRLQDAAYSAPDIGTVTPISNDATVLSYPQVNQENPLPSDEERLDLARAAWAANEGAVVDIPSAHGFCMFIRRQCLDEVGLLREDVFGQGYGEENDFSVRAWNKGWRNVAVSGVYVAHVGGQSFASARVHLVKRNLRIMNRLHPGYDRLVQDWLRADPLAPARRRIDVERLNGWKSTQDRLVLFLTHNRGGGVARHVRERAQEMSRIGMQVALLRPGIKVGSIELRYGLGEDGHNLNYNLPNEISSFVAVFNLIRPIRIEIHHSMDIPSEVMEHLVASRVPYSITVHDYHWYCGRINLTKGRAHYCGEPPPEFCRQCLRAEGTEFAQPIDPVKLQAASRNLMAGAVAVIAPSLDTANRISRRLDILPQVRPWEQLNVVGKKPVMRASPDTVLRVCIVGAIGWEKGFGVLLMMAQIIEFERLPIELRVVGFTCDDSRLGAFACVSITGRYTETEIVELIEKQQAHLGFLPAVWPETWSYVLTSMWDAGLVVVAFDVGAPAERIRNMGGYLFPLKSSLSELLQSMLKLSSPDPVSDS